MRIPFAGSSQIYNYILVNLAVYFMAAPQEPAYRIVLIANLCKIEFRVIGMVEI